MVDANASNQALFLIMASFKKDLDDIKKRMDEKKPYLSTEEALEGFREYLEENSKPNTKRSFVYPLREFEKEFAGQNIAEITAYRLQEFLSAKWGKGKKTVVKQSLSKLKWFYSWSIKYVKIKGMPPFFNPCELIEVKEDGPPERPEFIPVEKMRELVGTMERPEHRLATLILATAGLRVSELIGDKRAQKPGIRKKDANGRVLTIRNPKSGKQSEIAIIPAYVAEELRAHITNMGEDDLIIQISYSTLYDVIKTHAGWVGLDLHPHGFRKWCATFWSRLHEYAMSSFVLRHSDIKASDATLVTSLGARYIAPLSVEEVMAKQDQYVEGIM